MKLAYPTRHEKVGAERRLQFNAPNGLFMEMAAQFINVTNKTIKTGDAYGVEMSYEPVTLRIVADKGVLWSSGSQ